MSEEASSYSDGRGDIAVSLASTRADLDRHHDALADTPASWPSPSSSSGRWRKRSRERSCFFAVSTPAVAQQVRMTRGLLILFATLAATQACAHGGGLDAYGCHHNRKEGGYHCHRGPLAGETFGSQAEMLKKLEKPPDRNERPADARKQ